MRLAFVLLASLLLCQQVDAAAVELPNDELTASCIDANSTTAGMIQCSYEEYERWDQALNAAYKALLAGITSPEKQAFRVAQRQWIMFRDAEFKAIDAIYSRMQGTMYLPMRVAERVELVKARALQLNGYATLQDE